MKFTPPNSLAVVWPTGTAPACRSRATMVESTALVSPRSGTLAWS